MIAVKRNSAIGDKPLCTNCQTKNGGFFNFKINVLSEGTDSPTPTEFDLCFGCYGRMAKLMEVVLANEVIGMATTA